MKKKMIAVSEKSQEQKTFRASGSLFHAVWCTVVMCLGILMPSVMYATTKHLIQKRLPHADESHLTFITLSFNNTQDQKRIEHNCALISESKHRFIIYTDDLAQPHCSLCTCVPFSLMNCRCPNPAKLGCKLCEKTYFIKDRIIEHRELVFLDSDLIILQKRFLDHMYSRSREFDFLASYGFGDPCKMTYQTPFNSGLFFIRRLPMVNYSDLVGLMIRKKINNDQNALSMFVRSNYRDWDSMSLKWHCRFILGRVYAIRPEECYTLHCRGSGFWKTLKELNQSLQRIS